MKITILLPLLTALMCGALLAEPMDVNGRFPSKKSGGFPDGWAIHEWGGHKPFPAVKTTPGAHGGNTALSISNVLGDDGGAIQTRARFPARSGSIGRISLLAKGKGLTWVTFCRWGEKGAWNGVIVSSPFTLSDTWQPHVLTIPIDNGHACETHAVTLAIGGKMGAEIQVCRLTLDIQPPRIVGDTRMPKSWTIFAPVDKDLNPSREQLQSIPEIRLFRRHTGQQRQQDIPRRRRRGRGRNRGRRSLRRRMAQVHRPRQPDGELSHAGIVQLGRTERRGGVNMEYYKGHDKPASRKLQFDHVGLIATEKKPGERFVAATKVWVTDIAAHPSFH